MSPSLAALAVATLVSEDLTTITAGLLVGEGRLHPAAAIAACAVGIYVGDLGLWLLGRTLGRRALEWGSIADRLPVAFTDRFGEWFAARSGALILGSRFTPGARLPLYLAAGAVRSSFRRFAGWSALAVAVWTPALVGVSAVAGDAVARWLALGRVGLALVAVCGLMGWRLGLRLGSRRGRQRALAALSRVWRWEFWPMWLFYLPVACWTLVLALRYGGYRTLTAANPGIRDGGVVGESKHEILAKLDPAWTIPSVLIDPAPAPARRARLERSMAEHSWTFPVILKPDVGQRGGGVRLLRDVSEAESYLREVESALVLQPYHPGPFEAGIFYYRRPGSRRGRILCITDKTFPAIVGDGRSTIEDLVWAHPRYRMQASTFMARLGPRRHDVPADGVTVPLGIAGNHAQGAMFTDGSALITPALEQRIEAIAASHPGFYVGRFDVRYRDRAAFMAGDDLAIVELNGATAECTNIYDPAGSLVDAYRQLFRQWRLVFAIGAENRRRGHAASPAKRLRALLRAHLTARPLPVSD